MTATSTNPTMTEQDERRTNACIAACAGLTTEALEGGIIQKMLISLTSANEALDACAARAAQHIPDGFIPLTERLPLMGEDHQQLIEKRGESVAVIAWRYPPGGGSPSTVPPAPQERAMADEIERVQVTP